MPSSQTGWPDGTQAGAAGGGASSIEIQQNGVAVVSSPSSINFIDGFTVTNPAGSAITVQPPLGGSAGGYTTGVTWVTIPIVNGNFETGDATGWVVDVGTQRVVDWSQVPGYSTYMSVTNHGTYFFNGGQLNSGGQDAVEAYQDISLTGDDGFAYNVTAEVFKNVANGDHAFVELSLLDTAGKVLSRQRSSPHELSIGAFYAQATVLSNVSAVTLRIRVGCVRTTGTDLNASLDNVVLTKAKIPTAGAAEEKITSRYWRLSNMVSAAAADPSCSELRFNTIPGGSRLTGVVSASSEFNSNFSPAKAQDSDTSTLWASIQAPAWYAIDLGSGNTSTLQEISITARSDTSPNQTPTSYAVEYSNDGVTWVTLGYVVDSSGSFSLGETRTYNIAALTTKIFANNNAITPNEVSVNYSLTEVDFEGIILKKVNSTNPVVLTIPSGLAPRNECSVIRHGTGSVTFVAGSGVTLRSADNNLTLRSQYSSAAIVPTGTPDEYYILGDLA